MYTDPPATAASTQRDPVSATHRPAVAWVPLLFMAAAIALLHLLTNNRYGFHRDELQFLADARHLDWGFVAYPPVTPFLERILLGLFGVSLVGLRLFSVLAQSAAIVLTGLMARELGGRRLAQVIAALAVALSPLPLFEGTQFQYSSFDFLWWTLIALFLLRLLRSQNPRWWLAVGAAIGLALLTKYTVTFFLAGLLGGLILTPARRWLVSPWFYAGAGLALLLFLPNLLWQVHHHFISLDFLHHIHTRDVRIGRGKGFLKDQFVVCANIAATPLWIAGLIALFRRERFRLLAWMYVIPLALFFFGKGRGYYLAAAYPMLFAAGGPAFERWAETFRPWPRLSPRALPIAFGSAIIFVGLLAASLILPLLSIDSPHNIALRNNEDLREEIGWTDLVRTTAAIRDGLSPAEQQSLGIIVGNYGERGAIEILGPDYHLPPPISTTNSAWLLGPPSPEPATYIVLGNDREDADSLFTACRLAGHNTNPWNVSNEESRYHPDIFVCTGLRKPLSDIWKDRRAFG